MKPNEALNRLEAELEKAIPYWQEKNIDLDERDDLIGAIYEDITRRDYEIEVAFKDLIRAIIENKDTNE